MSAPHQPAAHSTRSARSGQADQLEEFAAAVAHELRTPLAALSGEVEIALRRERTAAAYRDALSRIAASVAELVELTGDLTFLGQQSDDDPLAARRARPDRILARVAERHAANAAIDYAIGPALNDVVVSGDEGLLARAVTLVVEHGIRHRREQARLTLRAEVVDAAEPRLVEIVLSGGEAAFWPHTWESLDHSPEESAPRLTSGPLRLRTADSIIRRCGGLLYTHASPGGSVGVHIRLRTAEPM